MANKTSIEWTEQTWNFLRGCRRVSEGCRNCYAEQIAGRFSGVDKNGKELPYFGLATKNGEARWTGKVSFHEDILLEPLKRKTPTTYFVNSMSDLFYEEVSDEWIDKAFAIMALTPQHTYQILTKRPERMRDYFNQGIWEKDARLYSQRSDFIYDQMFYFTSKGFKFGEGEFKLPLPNVWLGVSVENQKAADERIPLLLETPATIRFLSCEPLLSEIDLSRWLNRFSDGSKIFPNKVELDWVIVGGESGNGARPFHLEYALGIIRQCRNTGTKVFFKQAGAFPVTDNVNMFDFPPSVKFADWGTTAASARIVFKDKKGGDLSEMPEDLQIREMPTVFTPVTE